MCSRAGLAGGQRWPHGSSRRVHGRLHPPPVRFLSKSSTTTQGGLSVDGICLGELVVDINPHRDMGIGLGVSDQAHTVLGPAEQHVDAVLGRDEYAVYARVQLNTRALLRQSAELASRDVVIGCCSSSFRELHLDDIAYDTGHVLIHFLVTGSYQCLKPQGDTTAKRYASEFSTALRAYVAAESLQLPYLRDLARREMIRLGDKLSLPSLIDIMEESWLSLSTLPGIVAYVESRILAFAESVTHPTAEKVLSEIGTPNTLSKVLLKIMLLLKTSEVAQKDESLRKEELVEILRGLTDSRPGAGASRSKVSDVDRAMKEAEEQAAREAEEQAAAVAVAQRIAAAQAAEAEAVREEEEIALLLAKKARRRGKLLRKDRARLSILEENASKRSEARAACEVAEAEATHVSNVPAADKVASAEQSFVLPTPEVKSCADRDISDPLRPQSTEDVSIAELASSENPKRKAHD
ncbi:hypothetical protein B0J13DRAFT_613856 [Dactylonectria estremocensis]|uniref:Uncharacterized protein n=1 Tax=Dactylonectria estremocensis TaxID=1079267 RepID=A0A9P9D6H6_9HYPO|nr:hypothetical protein B0J13DRAFT_613856 [Dactylonectria estremocensis]